MINQGVILHVNQSCIYPGTISYQFESAFNASIAHETSDLISISWSEIARETSLDPTGFFLYWAAHLN